MAKLFFAGAEDLVLLEIDPAAFVSPTWIVGKMGDAAPDADTVAASPTTVSRRGRGRVEWGDGRQRNPERRPLGESSTTTPTH